jgi:Protein phosphatase 2C
MWRFAAGRATGSSHEKIGKPCQDRHACVALGEQDALVAVVADGAGTAEYAHVGAELAVTTMSDMGQLGVRAGRRDYRELLRESAAIARQRLVEAAGDRKVTPRDMACTLLAVIATPFGGAALQIGDGVIVLGNAASEWRWAIWPQKGEYANATFFLSDERALAQAEVVDIADDAQDIAMMSDGMEPMALHFASRSAHAPFFRTVFAPLHASTVQGESPDLSQAVTQLLGSAAVRARTDDDTTLLLATRRLREG